MSHKEQKEYINNIKQRFPECFENKKVLNIGSFNVNGGEKEFFKNCKITGVDLAPGKDVDVICSAHLYDAQDLSFDVVISCECWEHNPYFKESIRNALRMLKHGGFFLFTCASTGRPTHGTLEQDKIDRKRGHTLQGNPTDSWVTMPNVSLDDWDNNYYKNITIIDIIETIDLNENFSEYSFEINNHHFDLYFLGFKK